MVYSSNGTNDAIKLSLVPEQNNALVMDTVLMVSNGSVVQEPLSNAFSNVSVTFGSLTVTSNSTPANSSATANVAFGTIWTDGIYLYVGCANGITKRVSLTTF